MSSSKITITSFVDYLANQNDDLFSKLVLPDGIDRETLINTIELNCADFEVMYSNPYFMQDAIGLWSNKWNRTFTKWVTALNIEYKPLANYDRTDDLADTTKHTGTTSDRHSGDNTVEHEGTITDSATTSGNITNNNTDTSTAQKAAFDSSTFQNDNKVSDVTSGTSVSSSQNSNSRTLNNSDTTTFNDTNTTTFDDTTKVTHTGSSYGNIGVKTTQSILLEELDVAEWNLYQHIADLFADEFCLQIYI